MLSCAIDGMYLNSELFSHFRGSSNIGYLKIKKNDLILSAQNLHLGNCNVNLRFEHGIISPAYKVYELVECDPLFMQAWVKQDTTKDFFLRASTEGASVCRKNIVWEELYKQTLPVPTIAEQEKIGLFFDELDNLITLHQRESYRSKGKHKTWEQRKLGELVISHNAGIYISKEDYGTGTNVIGVGNIYDNDIFDGEIYRLGPVNDEKFLLEENDLIYGESSLVPEGIARTVCVGKNGVGSAFAWHTRRVKLDQSVINSHFATLELNYNIDVRKYLISVSTQTALTGMTTEGYFGVTLSLPTVEEQAHISSLFKQLDNLITLHRRT